MRKIILLLSFIAILSCSDQDLAEINVQSEGLIWNKRLSETGNLWNHGLDHTGLLCVAQFNETYGFTKLDLESGDVIYSNNLHLPDHSFLTGFRNENHLVIPVSNDLLCLNTDTGDLIWKNSTSETNPHLREYISGNNDTFYTVRYKDGESISCLYEGEVKTGELNLVYKPELIKPSDYNRWYLGGVEKVAYYKNSNNENMLLMHLSYYGESTRGIDWIKTYNLDREEFIIDSIPVYHIQVSWPPVFEEEYVYLGMTKGTIAKINLKTGDKIWQKSYDRFLNIHEMLVVDDNLFFLTDGAYGLFHSVDKNTGEINWTTRTKAGAIMSIMRYYKDHIYFSSFNSAGIHAFNIHSGREVWYKKPPEEHGSNFLDTFYLLPGKNGEKGRIFTRTLTHMYCYETIN